MKTRSNKNHTKTIIISVIAVLLVAGGAFVFVNNRNNKPTAPTTAISNTPNLSPPTEEEKQQSSDTKEKIVQEQESTPTEPPTTKKSVTPIITSAGYYSPNVEVGGFVPGIFEDGGVCTLTLTSGSSTVTKQSAGSKNATTTNCANFVVPKSELSTGSWTLKLSYSSSTAEGSSATKTVEVQ